MTEAAVDAGFGHARLLDWADRVRSADAPVSLLVARPAPVGRSPSYPSAVAAYREIVDLVPLL